MIGKGKSIAHTLASIKYGWNQEKETEVVFRQHISGETPQEVAREIRFVQKLNMKCSKNTLSFVLSPSITDGKKLSSKDLRLICGQFMKEMKLGERQAIAYVHRNKKHTHVHLYVNRVNFRGQVYQDSFIGKRSQMAAERVAKDLHLSYPREVQLEKQVLLKDVRAEIKKQHDLVLQQSKPKDLDRYIELMKTKGVKVIPYINKAGELQGFRFEYKGQNLKGSEVHRSMSGGKITASVYGHSKDYSLSQKPQKVSIAGKAVKLSPNLLKYLGKNMLRKVVSQGLDIGF